MKATNLLKEFGSVSEIERLLKEDYEFIEKKAGKKTTEILKTYFSENNNNENEI